VGSKIKQSELEFFMLNTIQIDENLVCACYVEEDNNLCGNTSQGSYAMVCH